MNREHHYSDEVVRALAELRIVAAHTGGRIATLVDTLDNAGVFDRLDEQADYAAAGDILAEHAVAEVR